MKAYRLLIIGDLYDNHIVRLVNNLKSYNPLAEIDLFSVRKNMAIPENIKCNSRNIFLFSPKIRAIPYYYSITYIIKLRKELNKISKTYHYDVVNIHYPNPLYSYCIGCFKRLSKELLITPWGSDVYRISDAHRRLLVKLYNASNHVCGIGNRFNRDVQKFFHVSSEKFVYLGIGLDMIDCINDNASLISTIEAKKHLGLQDNYVITCGYNGHKAQNHIRIIEALAKVKEKLPPKLTLLFPVTYPSDNSDYICFIKESVKKYQFNGIIFDSYLENEELFVVRQATDMFIHMQNTDANSGSLQEYLLLGKKVINAGWLRYDTMEKYGIPYYLADNFDKLPDIINNAYNSKDNLISNELKQYLRKMGWKSWVTKWNQYFENTCD